MPDAVLSLEFHRRNFKMVKHYSKKCRLEASYGSDIVVNVFN